MAAFEQANPGIKVKVENSEWSGYWDKLATHDRGQRRARRHPDGRGLHRARTAAAVRCST